MKIYPIDGFFRKEATKRLVLFFINGIFPKTMNRSYLLLLFFCIVQWCCHQTPKPPVIFNDYQQGLHHAREHQQPIFLIFNGYGIGYNSTGEYLNDTSLWPYYEGLTIIEVMVDDRGPLGPSNVHLWRNVYGLSYFPVYYLLDTTETPVLGPRGYMQRSDMVAFLGEFEAVL